MPHVIQFYKNLFGPMEQRLIFLSNNFWPDSGKVKEADKEDLIKVFSEDEVKHAVFDMKQDAAPGPNGFGATFFQKFWEVIKGRPGCKEVKLWGHNFSS